ncbi:hypothetical protein ACMGEE_20580 [Erwinia sp. DT-104]|nr:MULTISPECIES: hypothetical protein [unclassified Erwinia]MDN4628105.1 hypothetical protein [Erwinia sp. PsM31]MDN8541948.1 hypothetical protein [Erwinia sp. BC051422]
MSSESDRTSSQVTHGVRSFKEGHFMWDAAGNQTDEPGDIIWHNLLKS